MKCPLIAKEKRVGYSGPSQQHHVSERAKEHAVSPPWPPVPTFATVHSALSRDTTKNGIFGAPEDALEKIARLQKLSGGFGTVLCFAHDWAPRELTLRSYEMLARYVMPHTQGLIRPLQASANRVQADKANLMERAGGAILKAIRDYNDAHPRNP
jgi:hypothetical protein